MAVHHVLKDGTKLESIKGHVVRRCDAEAVYSLMEKINEKERDKTK